MEEEEVCMPSSRPDINNIKFYIIDIEITYDERIYVTLKNIKLNVITTEEWSNKTLETFCIDNYDAERGIIITRRAKEQSANLIPRLQILAIAYNLMVI